LTRLESGTSAPATKKRSIVVNGHKSSISLEDEFWDGLVKIAEAKRMTLIDLVGQIDEGRLTRNLSSCIRLFILQEAREGRLGPKSSSPPPRRYRRVSATT